MYYTKNEDYLAHHGVLGQKWGIRRYQNPDGTLTEAGKKRYIPKGTEVGRVSLKREDPTYDNKKYVSLNEEDHRKWSEYLGSEYLKMNAATFDVAYKTTKDLRVMTLAEQGEKFVKMLEEDKDFMNMHLSDMQLPIYEYFNKSHNKNIDRNVNELSVHFAAETKTGKKFIESIINEYDALEDAHGRNLADDPIIVLNPDKNLERIQGSTYTKEVQEFLDDYYRNARYLP